MSSELPIVTHKDKMLALAIMIEFNGSYEKLPLLEEWMAKERTASEDLIAELTKALSWYAEHVAGCKLIHSDVFRNELNADGGQRASAAIAKAKGQINE